MDCRVKGLVAALATLPGACRARTQYLDQDACNSTHLTHRLIQRRQKAVPAGSHLQPMLLNSESSQEKRSGSLEHEELQIKALACARPW